MFKKILFLATLTLSSLSHAGAIVGNLAFIIEAYDVNLDSVTLDETRYRDEIGSNAASLFPNHLNFSMYLDQGPQISYYDNSGVYKTHDQITGATIRSLSGSFSYTDNSFRASFYTHGFDCLQGSGILLPIYNPHNDLDLGLSSECYNTINFFELTLGKLPPATYLNYNNLQGTNDIITFRNPYTRLKITKTFYDKDKYLKYRDFDEMIGSLGSLTVDHHLFASSHVGSEVYITYVPETESFALFTLGIFGLLANQRKKKSTTLK